MQEGLYGRPALLAMLGIALAVLLAALDQTVVGTALPTVVAELQGFALYAWVATAYLLTATAMLPLMGKLSDLYGRKPFLLVAIAVFVGASAAAGAAPTMLFLVVARGIQGIGAGMLQATAFTSVGDMFPQPERRARWQGILSATMGIASVVGPAIGGILTDSLGWRSVFYVNLPIGILAIGVLWFTLPAGLAPRVSDARIDWVGAATVIGGVSALILAVEWGGTTFAWTSLPILTLLGLSLGLFGAFVLIERRVPEPIIPLDLFRRHPVAVSAAIALVVGFVLRALSLYTPLLAQGALGMSASAAGALLTPLLLGATLGSIASSQLFAHFHRTQWLLASGACLLMAGAFLLALTDLPRHHLLMAAELGLCGLGTGFMLPMMTVIVQSSVPHPQLGVGTSSIQFLRLIGSTLGTAIIGPLVRTGYTRYLTTTLPGGIDVRLASAVRDPQVLVNPAAVRQLQSMAQGIGPTGPAELQLLLQDSRAALVTSIQHSYWIVFALGVATLALALTLRAEPVTSPAPAAR